MAPMTRVAQAFPATKNASRIKAAGMKIRTSNFTTDVSSFHGKAQAIASTDWRKTASGTSSYLGISNKPPGDRREGTNSSSDMSDMCVEMDYINTVEMRRPKDEPVAWEMVVSAPGRNLPTSPSSCSSVTSFEGFTAVHITDAKPMTINVNGEEIALDNSFSLDIVPIQLSHSSRSSMSKPVAYMKRIFNPDSFPRMLSRDTGDLHAEFRKLVEDSSHSGPEGIPPRATPKRPERNRSDSAFDDKSSVSRLASTHGNTFGTDKARFQKMLERLHNPVPAGRELPKANDIRLKDPAIVAARVKDVEEFVERQVYEPTRYTKERDAFWSITKVPRQESSHDSGYSSSKTSQLSGSTVIHTLHGGSLSEEATGGLDHRGNQSKRLNPAAAEFRSIFGGSQMPLLSPKKLTRAPLTNVFPEAGRCSPPKTQDDINSRRFVPGLHQPRNSMSGEASQQRLPDNGGTEGQPVGNVPLVSPHPKSNADNLSTANAANRQGGLPMPLSVTMNPPPGLPAPTLSNTFGTYPSPSMPLAPPMPPMPTMPPVPFELGQPPMGGFSGFGTFPGNLPQLPVMPPIPGVVPSATPLPPYMGPPISTGLPNPLVNAGAKVGRPHFPVTQKPRDHDPVKQQQYEAYLEWRKANEPGYHIRCKMRQAQRIVRQHAQSTQRQDTRTVAEQLKASVETAKAVADAEKKSSDELKRAEFNRMVREKSEEASRAEARAAENKKPQGQAIETAA